MTAHQSVGAPYGIKGFPTIKFFGYNKNKPTDYNGQRTADALGDESFKQLRFVQKHTCILLWKQELLHILFRKLTKDKASGGKSSGGSSGGGNKKSGGGNKVNYSDDKPF